MQCRAGQGRAEQSRAEQGRAEERFRTGAGGGLSGVGYRCRLKKKTRSHVLVLLHTRQSSGFLVKEIIRQSELSSGILELIWNRLGEVSSALFVLRFTSTTGRIVSHFQCLKARVGQ